MTFRVIVEFIKNSNRELIVPYYFVYQFETYDKAKKHYDMSIKSYKVGSCNFYKFNHEKEVEVLEYTGEFIWKKAKN